MMKYSSANSVDTFMGSKVLIMCQQNIVLYHFSQTVIFSSFDKLDFNISNITHYGCNCR